ncbi:MAG: coproporphyrinogen-III oxidase family protein [Leptospirillia bacterium]
MTEEAPRGAGVYVQVPFCPDRCDYCAVPVSVSTALLPRYLEALAIEARRVEGLFQDTPPVSLYVGGGSPLSLPREALFRLLEILSPFFPKEKEGEVTFESRPEDLAPEILEILRRVPGIRLSVGIEGGSPDDLERLGRRSAYIDPQALLKRLRREIPEAAISMDFIVGEETTAGESFLATARALLTEGLDHLSVYPLVVESRTVFSLRKSQGLMSEHVEEVAAERWVEICQTLSAMGWHRYEVSNFSKRPESLCRHNCHVWQGGNYLGLGAGAHQRIGRRRRENVRSILSYVRMIEEGMDSYGTTELLTDESYDIEYLYGNLRLSEGISTLWLKERVGDDAYDSLVSEFVRINVVDQFRTNERRLVLNDQGLSLLDPLVLMILDQKRSPDSLASP